MKTVEDYVKADGTHCPACGSDDIEGRFVEVDLDCAFQEIACNCCNSTWRDVYQLINYDSFVRGDQLITGVLGKPEPAFPELGGKSLASTVHTAPGESVIEKVMELPNKWEPDSGWDDHPDWPREDWAYECQHDNTFLGYVDWVNAQIDAWEDK
jgi:hypothetical protein